MDEHKGKAKNMFWQKVHNKSQNKDVGSVPEMLKKDRPTYRLKPPALAHSIDAQSFNSRCQVDINTHKQNSPIQASKTKETVTKQFNRAQDPLDQITDKQRDKGLSR